jgi:saccharopine dehydrogenase (NAD+, L-lysine-forming)
MINPRTLLILGGYGITGSLIAQLLLRESDVRVVLAGRNTEKATAKAAELNRQFSGERVRGCYADAADEASLRQAYQRADMVVAASSTSQYAAQVAGMALEIGLDYLDVQYSTSKIAVLKALADRIKQAGLCFVTDGGFHPGLPAALIAFAAQHFDEIHTANVGSVIKINWRGLPITDATISEMIEEFQDYQSLIYQNGTWKSANWWSTSSLRYMDFGREFGRRYSMPMFLEELRCLPELFPTLKEAGFYVGSFNWFVDWILFPLLMVMIKLAPRRGIRPAGRLMLWGLRTFTKPPYGTLLKMEAQGEKDGKNHTAQVSLYHPDGYWFTAIPAVACLLQVLDGSRREPGLWCQANLVEPKRFLAEMQRMGVEIQKEGLL